MRSKPLVLTAIATRVEALVDEVLDRAHLRDSAVPVEMTLNSLRAALTSGSSAKAFAVFTIWMRHVLPTKPLTSAIRYGGLLRRPLEKLRVLVAGREALGHRPRQHSPTCL